MFLHYIKVAFRNLWKYKTQSLISIAGLAVGIVCFVVCLYVPMDIIEYNRQVPKNNKLYSLSVIDENDLKQFPEIKQYTYNFRMLSSGKVFTEENGQEILYPIKMMEVDNNFIPFFSLKLLHGDRNTIRDTQNGVLLFESQAKEIGNPEELIGKMVATEIEFFSNMSAENKSEGRNDYIGYKVVGILENPTGRIAHFGSYALMLNRTQSSKGMGGNSAYWVPYIELNNNTAIEQFAAKLDELSQKTGKEYSYTEALGKKSLSDNSLAFALFIFGILLFVTALFNFLSLYMVQFYNRLKECAVRKVNGAREKNILALFYVETVLGFLISIIIAFLVVEALFPFLESLFDKMLRIHLEIAKIRVQLVQYTLGGLLFLLALCIIPAFQINRQSIKTVLLGVNKRGRRQYARNVMLFFQLFIIVAFISAASVVWLQTQKTREQIFSNIPKTEISRIFSANTNSEMLLSDKTEIIIKNLEASPTIEAATLLFGSVIKNHHDPYREIRDFSEVYFNRLDVEAGFFDFFHGKIVAGRAFEQGEKDVVVINRKFADLYEGESPVGKTFTMTLSDRAYQIIGVVEDIELIEYYNPKYDEGKADKRNYADDYPMFYRPSGDRLWQYTVYARAAKGKEKEAKEHLSKCMNEFMTTVPDQYKIKVSSFSDDINKLFSAEMALYNALIFFFVVCLLLGLLSIYSSVLLAAEKRQKEIAIRKINGAEVKDIIRLFLKTYVMIWTFVCVLAFPLIGFAGEKWLERYTERISINVPFFAVIYVMVLLLIVLSIIWQIVKTARLNPADVVKTE